MINNIVLKIENAERQIKKAEKLKRFELIQLTYTRKNQKIQGTWKEKNIVAQEQTLMKQQVQKQFSELLIFTCQTRRNMYDT